MLSLGSPRRAERRKRMDKNRIQMRPVIAKDLHDEIEATARGFSRALGRRVTMSEVVETLLAQHRGRISDAFRDCVARLLKEAS
jgi:hypothetical protein